MTQSTGLIDSHLHLDGFARSGTLPAVLRRANEAGLEMLVAIGTACDDWGLYQNLARESPKMIAYTVGIHPCSVEENWKEDGVSIEGYFRSEMPPVALGETGLDRFHLPKSAAAAEAVFELQRKSFAWHLALGRELNCPLVVHSRGAFMECVEMVDHSGVDWRKVVFHCFSEGPGEIDELVRRGGRGSFTGILTYKNAELVRDAALHQGLDTLMLETDSPYLAPVPHRGKRNEPAFLRQTAEYACKLFGVDYATLVERTTATVRGFYGLSERGPKTENVDGPPNP